MCLECGCGEDSPKNPQDKKEQINKERQEAIADPIGKDLLSKNDRIASHNRDHIRNMGSFMVHLTSSPGSGKTTLLEETVKALKDKYRIGVIEGDVATENDAKRVGALGVPTFQIETQGVCHLDAKSVHHALGHLGQEGPFDLVFVENVGNLVCPAGFDLGEDQRVVLVSVTEGDDKPEKYPPIFRRADVIVVSKTDLLPHVEFNVDKVVEHARVIAPRLRSFKVSSKTGEGIDEWISWLGTLIPDK